MKLYLSHRETEDLCFKKVIEIPDNRALLTKATSAFKFCILMDEGNLLRGKNNLFILNSAVNYFELPQSEYNLFTNHYHLPLRLLKISDRKYKEENTLYDNYSTSANVNDSFLNIRRSLINIFLTHCQSATFIDLCSLIESFEGMPKANFKTRFINELINQKGYPKLKVDINEIKDDSFYQYAWWGKYIVDLFIKPQQDLKTPEEIADHRKWLQQFDPENQNLSKECLTNIPILYLENYSFIVGYIMVIRKRFSEKAKLLDEKLLETSEGKDQLKFWIVFFESLFRDDIDYFYPNPLIQDDFLFIERIAFKWAISEMVVVNFPNNEQIFKQKEKLDIDLIKNYYAHKNGIENAEAIRLIKEEEISLIFQQQTLAKSNQQSVGFISDDDFNWYNKINIKGNQVYMNIIKNRNNIIFYSDISVIQKQELKECGINVKIKPLSSILDPKKKILFTVYRESVQSINSRMNLLYIYREIIESIKKLKLKNLAQLEKCILIYEVSEGGSRLHSTEFAIQTNQIKKQVEDYLNMKVILIVTDPFKKNDTEVIRNIRASLKDFKIENVEVIDDYFNNKHAKWLIEATNDYFSVDENKNYWVIN